MSQKTVTVQADLVPLVRRSFPLCRKLMAVSWDRVRFVMRVVLRGEVCWREAAEDVRVQTRSTQAEVWETVPSLPWDHLAVQMD